MLVHVFSVQVQADLRKKAYKRKFSVISMKFFKGLLGEKDDSLFKGLITRGPGLKMQTCLQ